MSTYVHANDTNDIQVRLVYSNAALLEMLNVHVVDVNPPEMPPEVAGEAQLETVSTPFEQLFQVADDDEDFWLMSYERLVNPPMQESPQLLWPWEKVKTELDRLHSLGPSYRGRRLYLLYNPATGRTNGTTHSFFATMTIRPAGIADRPHRHTAAAINYYFQGSGHSVVGGKDFHWKAGDLMLSAPGWQVHNHASGPEDVYELTIQDSPLHLAMDSLLWQEDLKRPPVLIGSHSGWNTNRAALERVCTSSAAPSGRERSRPRSGQARSSARVSRASTAFWLSHGVLVENWARERGALRCDEKEPSWSGTTGQDAALT